MKKSKRADERAEAEQAILSALQEFEQWLPTTRQHRAKRLNLAFTKIMVAVDRYTHSERHRMHKLISDAVAKVFK